MGSVERTNAPNTRGFGVTEAAVDARLMDVEIRNFGDTGPVFRGPALTADERIANALVGGVLAVNPRTGEVFRRTRRGTFRSTPGCRLRSGYREVQLPGDAFRAHRIVWVACHGFPPRPGMAVCHLNNDKGDNRIDNLALASLAANTDQAIADGLLRGRLGRHAAAIVARASEGASLHELARSFGSTPAYMHEFLQKQRRPKRVPLPYEIFGSAVDVPFNAPWIVWGGR